MWDVSPFVYDSNHGVFKFFVLFLVDLLMVVCFLVVDSLKSP